MLNEYHRGVDAGPRNPPSTNIPGDARGDVGHALRFNEGKLRYDLLPHEWERELVKVLTEGAKKYADHNWKKSKGTDDHKKFIEDRYASLRRHLATYRAGEVFDIELNTHHMAQVAWNALVIMYYDL